MSKPTLFFDDFELKAQPLALMRGGQRVTLSAQPLRLLHLLAAHAGEVISHEQIRDHLWGNRIVDFCGSMHVCIRHIRAALGDNGSHPRYIENIPRHGYRFIRTVRAQPVLKPADTAAGRLHGRSMIAAGVLMLLMACGLFMRQEMNWPARPGASAATDAYERGLYVLESDAPDSLERARSFFEEAIAADPGFAPAHAAMADSFQRAFEFNAARTYAQRALALDDRLPEAHLRVAAVLGLGDWKWAEAELHIHQALELDPEQVEAYHALASIYSVTGRLAMAAEPMEKALVLDPASTLLRADYGSFLYYMGRLDDARRECREALRLDPAHFPSRLCLFNIAVDRREYALAVELAVQVMEDAQASRAAIEEVINQPSMKGVSAFQRWRMRRYERADSGRISPAAFAMIHARLGDYNAALAMLEQAAIQRRALTPFIVLDPVFGPIRDDTRFRRVLRTMNVELS